MQKHTRPLPSLDVVSKLLSYNPDTGVLYWRVSLGKAKAGSQAGCQDAHGYRLIGISGRLLKAHRLAWLIHFGREPENDLDHINGNPDDNRICNLREASGMENLRNRKAMRTNKCGVKGVCWNRTKRKWMAYVNRRTIGYFATKEQADKAVREARSKVHGEFACHRV